MDDTVIKNVQIKDALYKLEIYLSKITKSNGSFGQVQKICHLAAQTCTKFTDSHQFNQKIYNRLTYLITQTRCYYLLYLLDILIKNTRQIMKLARNDLIRLFKIVWDQVYQQYKNNLKMECLKAMVKTWNLLYSSDNIQEIIQNWVRENYGGNLNLEKKYQEIYLEVYERFKPIEKKVEQEVQKSEEEIRNLAAYHELLNSLQ